MKRKIPIFLFLPFLYILGQKTAPNGRLVFRSKKPLALVLGASLLIISGCVPLIVGGAVGAVGAYAVSKDTIEGETDRPYDCLWNAALEVSKIRGTVKQEDAAKGHVELEADGSRVWIRLIRMTRSTTRVRIAARKNHLPNLDLAQDIYVKILKEAR